MSRTLSQEEMDEQMKNIEARAEDETVNTFSSVLTSPSKSGSSTSDSRHAISWTGTRNTAMTVQVSENLTGSSLSRPRRIINQNIKKWFKPAAPLQSDGTGMPGKKRQRSPSPIQRLVKSQRFASTPVDGATNDVLCPTLTSTPVRRSFSPEIEVGQCSILINGEGESNACISPPVPPKNGLDNTDIITISPNNKTVENLLALSESNEVISTSETVDTPGLDKNQVLYGSDINDTLSFKENLKNYISQLDSSITYMVDNDIKNKNKNNEWSLNQGTKQSSFINSASVSSSIPQVQKTLPTSAEPSWIPAKEALKEQIRFTHRAEFIQGALDNGVTEEWALQLERLPTFLTRIPEFNRDFYEMRLKHSKETMQLAVKHLKQKAYADKRTAKTLKGAAFLLTDQTLSPVEAKLATEAALKEWENLGEKTNYFELKNLRERKIKMESKVLSETDVIDPVSKILPDPTEQADQATTSRNPQPEKQDFGRRGRGQFRGRGRRGNNSRPYTKTKPKNQK